MPDVHTIDMQELALDYHSKGWSIFPVCSPSPLDVGGCAPHGADCKNPGKGPLVKWGRYQDVHATQDEIQAWWGSEFPDANIGIVTGPISGIGVIDLDNAEAVAEVEKRGYDPACGVAATGRGNGRHLYFAWRDDAPTIFAKASGIDFRGKGGFVLAPGSRHKTGRTYAWIRQPGDDMPPIPAWIDEMAGTGNGRGHREKIDIEHIIWEGIPEGERDFQLFRAAAKLRGAGVPIEFAYALLEAAAERCNPPFDDWRAKVESAYTRYTPRPGFSVGASRARAKAADREADSGDRPPDGPERGHSEGASPERYMRTDMGNAQRLIARHGEDLRYVHEWGRWLVWDGTRWVRDDDGAHERRAKDTVRSIYLEAKEASSDEEAKAIGQWAAQSQGLERLKAMSRLAQTEDGVAVVTDDLDSDLWSLNVANGTLDLRSGELRAHDRDDLITKIAPVVYDPDAECARWLSFLDQIMGGNAEMVRWLQKAVGYSLTGDTTERVMFVLHGLGKNGKSTFLEALGHMLGDYADIVPTEMLIAKQLDGGVPNDVAQLPGVRFGSASETEDGKRLAEAKIKQLTGGDRVKARFMRQEFFAFKPVFKLWLATNHKPEIRGTDDGIWDRIRLVPFLVRIDKEKVDRDINRTLQSEASGILRWALKGCLMWQMEGLGTPPQTIEDATTAYREEMDPLADFLERCAVGPAVESTARELYLAYAAWCTDAGERPLTKRRFGMRLRDRGFRTLHRNYGDVWLGIGLTGGNKESNPAGADVLEPHRRRIMAHIIAAGGLGMRRSDLLMLCTRSGEMTDSTFDEAFKQLAASRQIVPAGAADAPDTCWRRNMATVSLKVGEYISAN